MKKKIFIGVIFTILIGGILTFRKTKNINLTSETINYSNQTIAIKISEDKTNYSDTDTVPTGDYTLNTSKSICKVDGTVDSNITIEYSNGKVNFIGTSKKGTKCYLYFDKIIDTEKPKISNVTTSVTKTEINVTVTATDNKGVTEYWYQLGSNTAVKGTGNTYKFTGLSPKTTYSIKVYVKDAAGNQSDTTTKSVTTSSPTASETILANLGTSVKTTTPNFSQAATTNEGVYSTSDGMYGGTTYYWRGAVTNNHVIFANKCWRIVRINGDKTVRLIYNGTVQSGNTCKGNGVNADSIAVTNQAYNSSASQSNYGGWTYSGTSQRTLSGTDSNAKVQTQTWYNNNIGNNATYNSKVADGKFCNNRNAGSGYTWAINPISTFYYEEYTNLLNGTPSTSCPNGDVYTLKVGAITASEVMYAGGVYATNNAYYYLYNGRNYWTMSPYRFGGLAYVFIVFLNGDLANNGVSSADTGLRPVINLRSDVSFSSGNGEQNSPYIVS